MQPNVAGVCGGRDQLAELPLGGLERRIRHVVDQRHGDRRLARRGARHFAGARLAGVRTGPLPCDCPAAEGTAAASA